MVTIDEHDLGKTKIQILMDLIYESARVRIPEQWIKYGDPQILDARPDDPYDPNTFIPTKIDHRYNDALARSSGFMYRRRDLKDHLAGVTLEFPRFPITLRDMISEVVNPQLSYPLDPMDVEDYLINDPETAFLSIKPSKQSLLWMGGGSRFAIEPPDNSFFILVEIPFLTGFYAYAGEDEGGEPLPID